MLNRGGPCMTPSSAKKLCNIIMAVGGGSVSGSTHDTQKRERGAKGAGR